MRRGTDCPDRDATTAGAKAAVTQQPQSGRMLVLSSHFPFDSVLDLSLRNCETQAWCRSSYLSSFNLETPSQTFPEVCLLGILEFLMMNIANRTFKFNPNKWNTHLYRFSICNLVRRILQNWGACTAQTHCIFLVTTKRDLTNCTSLPPV